MLNKKSSEMMKNLFSCFRRQKSGEVESARPRRKMVIVGDGECGKTCLVTRMTTGDFVDVGYVPTVFETEVTTVNTGEESVDLVIYDTAGQEDYDRLRPFSYSDVDVVLICFSLAEPDSLVNVAENWSPEIRYFCGKIPVILVGNKKDLRDMETASFVPSKSPSISNGSVESVKSAASIKMEDPSKKSASSNPDTTSEDTPSASSATDVISSAFTTSSKPVFRRHAPVKHSEGAIMARRIGALAYFETSSLTGENVEELLLATTKAGVLGTKKAKKFKPLTETLKTWKSVDTLAK